MRSNRTLLILVIPAVLIAALVGAAFFRAQRTLTRTANQPRGVAFTEGPLSPITNPGFEPVASPGGFTAGTILAGDFYLAGSSGLTILAPSGATLHTLRSGLELPAANITAVTQGRLRGASAPQILIATAGAGVLLLTPNGTADPTLQQLLPSSAETRDLTALLPLATGDLLLGTRHHGLFVYTGGFDGSDGTAPTALTAFTQLPATLDITALAAPTSTSVLVGTRASGVFYLHAGTVTQATVNDGLPDNQVDAIVTTASAAYIGTPLGIAQFDLTALLFHPTRTLAPGLFAHALTLTPSGLSVGTLDQSIRQIPLTRGSVISNAASITAPSDSLATSPQRIDAFMQEPGPNARTYALADGQLLTRTGTNWLPAFPSPAQGVLADRNISALAFTPEGQLYVGFFDHGLDILNPETSALPKHFEDDHLFCINRLVLDPTRHTIAAATANGLVLFDANGTPRQTITRRDGLISDHISDIAFTPSGTALATPAGITFLTPAGPESLYAFQGLVNNHIYTLATGRGSQLLAGTLGGISLLDTQQVRRNFTASNSTLAHNWITASLPTPQGYLLGTYGAGLQSLSEQGVFASIDLPATAPKDLVINPNAMLATPTLIYAGTLGHGMLVYSNLTSHWSLVTQGLPSLNVTAFAAKNGNLYIGTENGLIRIPEARL